MKILWGDKGVFDYGVAVYYGVEFGDCFIGISLWEENANE